MKFLKYLRKLWHNDIICKVAISSDRINENINEIKQVTNKDEVFAELNKVKEMISFNCNEIVKFRDGIIRTTPRKSIKICIDIIEECNLNCASCLVFSPCAQKCSGFIMDIKQFESDIKRVSELFTEEEIEVLTISGGEPLLHHELNKFPVIVRKYLPNVNLRIVTNGILLLNQSEEFWNICRDNHVVLEQTKYPINIKFEKIKEVALLHNVKHIFMEDTGEVEKLMQVFPIDVQPISENALNSQNERLNFFNCWEANMCIRLANGRFYTCSRIPHIKLFNEYFKINLPITDDDSIDIYKVTNKEQIYEFLAKPVPFCRYCKVDKITKGHPWKQSELDIKEWTD